MRKDALNKLLAKYPNSRARMLTILLEEGYSIFPSDHDITFKDVMAVLQECGLAPIGLTHSAGQNHSADSHLFYQFITGQPYEEKGSNVNRLGTVPKAVSDYTLAPLLDAKSVANLSACSFTLYQQTKRIPYWKDKLLAVDCNPDQLSKVIRAKVIENYKKLYRTLLCFEYKFRNRLEAWELYCLSGEPKAILHAIQHEALIRETIGLSGRNALHYAAWSGSVEAMKYAIDTLKIAPLSTENDDRNALHYAAWGGSVEAMKYAIDTLKIAPQSTENDGANALHHAAWSGSVEAMKYAIDTLKIESQSTENNDRNALHYAAWSGSVEAMKYAIDTLKIAPQSTENDGANALHHAAWSGSVEAMKYAIDTLKIEPQSTENDGANALHNAAWSGSVEAMKYAIDTLKIAPQSTENDGANALHNAAGSGSVEAVRFVRQLSHRFNLKLDPAVRDVNGHDTFWYADQKRGNAAAIREALNMPIEKIIGQSVDEKNKEKVKVPPEEKMSTYSSSHSSTAISLSSAVSSSSPSSSSSSGSSAFFNSSSRAENHRASSSTSEESKTEDKKNCLIM